MPKKVEDKNRNVEDRKGGQSPAATPESRENQLVKLAVDLAEKQLRDGTASPTVLTHYLKIGSTREVIEREMIQKQAKLLEAKVSSMSKDEENSKAAQMALEALKSYQSSQE